MNLGEVCYNWCYAGKRLRRCTPAEIVDMVLMNIGMIAYRGVRDCLKY